MDTEVKKQSFLSNAWDISLDAIKQNKALVLVGLLSGAAASALATGHAAELLTALDYTWSTVWQATAGALFGAAMGLYLENGIEDDLKPVRARWPTALLMLTGMSCGGMQGADSCRIERSGLEWAPFFEPDVPKRNFSFTPTQPVLGTNDVAFPALRPTA